MVPGLHNQRPERDLSQLRGRTGQAPGANCGKIGAIPGLKAQGHFGKIAMYASAREGGMKPGEIITQAGDIWLNEGRETLVLKVANKGNRPVQVGSHYHFSETNPALQFDRAQARGFRLDIPAGTAIRFEPGQSRDVQLVPISGDRTIYGFRQDVMGHL